MSALMHIRALPWCVACDISAGLLLSTLSPLENSGVLLRIDICRLVLYDSGVWSGKYHSRWVLTKGSGGGHLWHLRGGGLRCWQRHRFSVCDLSLDLCLSGNGCSCSGYGCRTRCDWGLGRRNCRRVGGDGRWYRRVCGGWEEGGCVHSGALRRHGWGIVQREAIWGQVCVCKGRFRLLLPQCVLVQADDKGRR
ncbi:unnamed protein product [Chondrus crispus]|uniref:Secreted protein n=1 Tax=Chondrus crispus TaxID=2769 RepID=R7Q9C4_CHOCR|nr:unnamed protein product [Chondrus crispus]CDF34070.1 unnamed protein product [Chondrus crispus]|eukprot:XP_005713889.1 unnamed protein product [Chondrus crispus]